MPVPASTGPTRSGILDVDEDDELHGTRAILEHQRSSSTLVLASGSAAEAALQPAMPAVPPQTLLTEDQLLPGAALSPALEGCTDE